MTMDVALVEKSTNPTAEADFYADAAAALNEAEDYVRAEAACREALARVPGHYVALTNLGAALHRLGRHRDAIQTSVAAAQANPGCAEAFSNLGVVLNDMQAMALSLEAHDEAYRLAPTNPHIRANRAMALLMAGDLAQGFAEFESRWQLDPPPICGPRWQGEALAGRRLLVWDEGGYGDTLQFIRYVGQVLAAGARVVLRVQAPLVRLVRQSFPDAEAVVSSDDPVPDFDLHCPMISLAHVLGTDLATVPGVTPYLTPDPLQSAHWREALARLGPGRRVGLVWAGAPRAGMKRVHAMDQRRSMKLDLLAPLMAVPDVQWISLQIGGGAEIARTGFPLGNPMGRMQDFADTATLVAGLDLVISVDTAVVHLAGALGVPVWVMSRVDACWRWLAGREDTPWYPRMRVFRQTQPGEWGAVIERLRREWVA